MQNNNLFIGIDVGSVSINTILMDRNFRVLYEYYDRHRGEPLKTVKNRMEGLANSNHVAPPIAHIAVTGTGGKRIAEMLDCEFINEIVAHSEAVSHYYPHIKTVIEMGGEDSKLLLFGYERKNETISLNDFAMNTMCAAGTGSFLDQQAARMGIAIEEEFGSIALKSMNPPRIAGRCSVFAKSDMIHLQQIGTPIHDIVAGLCYALARSFKSSLGMGKNFLEPIMFQGGVAANKGLVRAFEDILGIKEGELVVPDNYASMGAIGALIIVMKKKSDYKEQHFSDLTKKLTRSCTTNKRAYTAIAPLLRSDNGQVPDVDIEQIVSSTVKKEAFLGVDIGSLSTNVVIIDENKNVIGRRYLRTAGRPLEIVKQGLLEIGKEIGHEIRIAGVGVTGSGRYMVGQYVGADVIKNEITAQATAAIHFFPDVDTIFEIGGQDSKYISLKKGTVVDFEMNKVCAAGTGSFIEEQSEKLGIDIKSEFGEYAFNSQSPGKFGDRCTVFIESDLVSHQQKGAIKEDLAAGLAYSIVQNYLNRVVGDRKIGNRVLFQGGVAWNHAVVASFTKITGKKITVPPHHDVTGAIGASLIAMNHYKNNPYPSRFQGFDLQKREYDVSTFECKACANVCNISRIKFEAEAPHHYGARCERFEVDKVKRGAELPNLFEEREKMLFGSYHENIKPENLKNGSRKKLIGIPRVLHMHEFFPYWRAFFEKLGFDIILSDWTNRTTISATTEKLTAETCFPVKIIHGHCLDLINKGVTNIFFPALINFEGKWNSVRQNHTCPLVQTAPSIALAALHSEFKSAGIKIISPDIKFHNGERLLHKELMHISKQLDIPFLKAKQGITAAKEAQEKYYQAALKRGNEIQMSLENSKMKGVVIISRSYNGCDRGLNMNLPKKLKDIGVVAIPSDFLSLDTISDIENHPNMYWKIGQRFLKIAKFLKNKNTLPAIHLSSFKCGPDSFITHFLKEEIGDVPVLELELDEHSADAGFITRCEAFFDSFEFKKVVEGTK